YTTRFRSDASLRRRGARGALPFGLGGQARAGPAGKGVGLVVADVAHRRMRLQRAHPAEGERLFEVRLPVQRPLPAFGQDPGPAIAEPQPRIAVPAILDELAVLGVAGGDRKSTRLN